MNPVVDMSRRVIEDCVAVAACSAAALATDRIRVAVVQARTPSPPMHTVHFRVL
jgi:hypothetical protein